MPLPPAPTKRAALLSPDAIDAPARSSHRGSRRSDASTLTTLPHAARSHWNCSTTSVRKAAGIPRESRRAKAKVETYLRPPLCPQATVVSAPRQPVAIQVETRVPTPAGAPAPRLPRRSSPHAPSSKSTGPAKLFVLDTNVLMHDPMCLFRFEEHDIFLPMIVLEELDGHKKGMTEVARNARQTSRTLDALAGTSRRRHLQGPEARHHRASRSRRLPVLPDRR
jgi:PhoH-like ATPase